MGGSRSWVGRSFDGRVHRLSGATAVVVPALPAETLLGQYRCRLDPSAAQGVPAHVTVMYPFVPRERWENQAVESRLCGILKKIECFSFWFRTIAEKEGLLYLPPEPGDEFRDLTAAVGSEFGLVPYRGKYEDPIPHCTVSYGQSWEQESPSGQAEVKATLEAGLPIQCQAREVWVMQRDVVGSQIRWSIWKRMKLGG